MGSPPGLPLKTRHVVAVVFGCLCLGGPPDLLEPLYGTACVQPATYCLCPARCLPLRYWLPHALCCRIPRKHGWPCHLASFTFQCQGLKGLFFDFHLHLPREVLRASRRPGHHHRQREIQVPRG